MTQPTQTRVEKIEEKLATIEKQLKSLDAQLARGGDNWDAYDQREFKVEEMFYWSSMLEEAAKRDAEDAAQAEADEADAEEAPAQRRARQRAVETLPSGVDPAPLAAWALDWHQAVKEDRSYPVDGVLVAADGTIVGETRNQGGTYRLTNATRSRYGLARNVLDMNRGALRVAVGQGVRHVRSWEVAPGRPSAAR